MQVMKDVVVLFLAGILAACILSLSLAQSQASQSDSPTVTSSGVHETNGVSLQTIEGRVQVEGSQSSDWISKTRVVVDGGRFYGYLRANGEFQIHGVPPGSYLIEVVSPNHEFQPARVDISSKSGKIRARKVNLLKTSSVSYLPYPLKFKVEKQAEFFVKREPWSALAMLKNPMVLLFVAPMLLMLLLPRLMKGMDPESQKVENLQFCSEAPETNSKFDAFTIEIPTVKEMQDMFQQQGSSMPSLEEMFTNLFGGGNNAAAAKKTKPVAKRPGSRR